MQAVILAGGLATRMRPLTEKIPKALIEVAGRPFIDWQLERLASFGYRHVVLCIAYLGEQIETHVGDGARLGIRVSYSNEGPTLLGTAGALKKAAAVLEDSFLVTYGDSYLPFDYTEPLTLLRAHPDCDGVMSVFHNKGAHDSSNVKTDGTWVLAYEKGTTDSTFEFIDYGALALRKSVLSRIPEGHASGLESIQTSLCREHKMRAVVAKDRFYEIGSPAGLLDLERKLASRSI